MIFGLIGAAIYLIVRGLSVYLTIGFLRIAARSSAAISKGIEVFSKASPSIILVSSAGGFCCLAIILGTPHASIDPHPKWPESSPPTDNLTQSRHKTP